MRAAHLINYSAISDTPSPHVEIIELAPFHLLPTPPSLFAPIDKQKRHQRDVCIGKYDRVRTRSMKPRASAGRKKAMLACDQSARHAANGPSFASEAAEHKLAQRSSGPQQASTEARRGLGWHQAALGVSSGRQRGDRRLRWQDG
jgi:hypothetical protein